MNNKAIGKNHFASLLLKQGGEGKTEKQKLLQRQKGLNILTQMAFSLKESNSSCITIKSGTFE